MGLPVWEIPSGTINGVNTTFTASQAYSPGSLAVFLNGQLLKSATDPWTETDPTTGVFDISDPGCVPRSTPEPDELSIFYLDTSDEPVIEQVDTLLGTLEGPLFLDGVLADDELNGTLEVNNLDGVLADDELNGTLEVERLSGSLECD